MQTYIERFTVRTYETRPDGLASLPTICNYFQETASNHARELNWAFDDLNKRNKLWALNRLTVDILDYPVWQEEVQVETWPSHGDKLRAYRDFKLLNKDGDVLSKAVSQWVILDMESRRPVPIPEEILDLSEADMDHIVPIPDKKIPLLNDEDQKVSTNIKAHFNDLDLNGHVNNVTYICWMLESLPNDLLLQNIPVKLDIQFRGECNAGNHIQAAYKSSEYTGENNCAVYQHALTMQATDAPVAAAELTLKHR